MLSRAEEKLVERTHEMLASRAQFADMQKIPRPPAPLRHMMEVVAALLDPIKELQKPPGTLAEKRTDEARRREEGLRATYARGAGGGVSSFRRRPGPSTRGARSRAVRRRRCRDPHATRARPRLLDWMIR